jgi:hypothetical protein
VGVGVGERRRRWPRLRRRERSLRRRRPRPPPKGRGYGVREAGEAGAWEESGEAREELSVGRLGTMMGWRGGLDWMVEAGVVGWWGEAGAEDSTRLPGTC